MPAVFTQMQCNTVSAGLFGLYCSLDRIGIMRAARLPEGRHMINIYTQ
jgi:hypothetical protein